MNHSTSQHSWRQSLAQGEASEAKQNPGIATLFFESSPLSRAKESVARQSGLWNSTEL